MHTRFGRGVWSGTNLDHASHRFNAKPFIGCSGGVLLAIIEALQDSEDGRFALAESLQCLAGLPRKPLFRA